MATEQIIIEYIAQVEGLKAQLRTVQTELKGVEKGAKDSAKVTTDSFKGAGDSIKGIATNIAASLAAAFTVGAVINFGKESIKAFIESEAAARKLEFAVTRIGKEGSAAFQKLTDQATKLSKVSIFDDEAIKGSQTMLIQLGLSSDQVERLLPKIIDLAAVTGEDLSSATSRAIAGINGLAKSNKDIGANFEDTGNKTQNLNILMEKLGTFSGAAADQLNTTAGKAKQAENELNELQETVGQRLVPFFIKMKEATLSATEAFADLVTVFDPLDAAISKNKKQTDDFITTYSKLDDRALGQQFIFVNKEINDLIQKRKNIEASGIGGEQEADNRIAASRRELKAIEELIKARQKGAEKDIGNTPKGEAEKEARIKKGLEDQIKSEEDTAKILADIHSRTEKLLFESAKAKTKNEKDELNKQLKDKEDQETFIQELKDKSAEAEQERLDKEKKAKEDIEAAELELFTEAANALFEFQSQKAQAELDQFQINADKEKEINNEKVNSGILSAEQAAAANKLIDDTVSKRRNEEAVKQAQRDKEQAIFNILLNTAVAVTKALAVPPLAALIAALGAIQLAAVIAKPLPKFAEGVIDLQGPGTGTSDSIHARLSKGESVMTAAETSRHKELLTSIRNDSLDKYLLENYINPKVNDVLKENIFANNVEKSLKLNGQFPDEYALARVMSRNKGVNLQNADYLASRIATEIASKVNQPNRTWS